MLNDNTRALLVALEKDGSIVAGAVLSLANYASRLSELFGTHTAQIEGLNTHCDNLQRRIEALEAARAGGSGASLRDVVPEPYKADGYLPNAALSQAAPVVIRPGDRITALMAMPSDAALRIAVLVLRWKQSPGDPAASLACVRDIVAILGPATMEEAQRQISEGKARG